VELIGGSLGQAQLAGAEEKKQTKYRVFHGREGNETVRETLAEEVR
jgi:hypothetical protein